MDKLFECNLHEALAILEEDEELEARQIFIAPPEPAVHSDEDSGDEDTGAFINNLSGRQLSAPCEVILTKNHSRPHRECREKPRNVFSPQIQSRGKILERRTSRGRGRGRVSSRITRRGGANASSSRAKSSSSSSSSDDSHSSHIDEPARKKTKLPARTWVKEDLTKKLPAFSDGNYSTYKEKSSLEIFELFWGETVINLLVDQSTKYAGFLNCPNPNITHDEMKAFIAILIISGYNTVPSKNHYWDQGSDMRNEMIYSSMRRDRFKTIMRFLHCADNTQIDVGDKMWKLKPLTDLLRNNFRENYVPSQALNYDESMIEYFGKHGCKQFIRGKPIRFGFKVWCLNTPYGYLVDFEIYQGKSVNAKPEYDLEFGKAAAPLVKMIDDMPNSVQCLPMSFYFDNLFTGFQLLRHLKSRDYNGTGTVRENRLPKDIPLINKKEMQKMNRGTYDNIKCVEDDICAVRWKDNSVVTAISTVHGVSPITNVSRYSAIEKKKVSVPRPAIFTEYNRFMGGTDLMDQNINTYRIGIRGKKWWWSIFTYLIDSAICNAWVLSRKAGNAETQLEFRRHIAQTYLTRYQNLPLSGGRPKSAKQSRTDNRVSDEIRFDGRNHLLVPSSSRRRCAQENCKARTRLECMKCDVGLCAACNYQFHTT